MVDSHQRPITAHLWRFAFRISKELSTIHQSLSTSAAGSLTTTYRKFFRFSIHVLRFTSRISNSRLRFVLRSFVSSVDWNRGQRPRLQRNRKVNDQAEWVISTPELNMLPCLHPEPIDVVVYHDPSGRSHLGIGLALRCFQRLSFPNIATQHCS